MYICKLSLFFQAEDGIRDVAVTGVQTCALPISETAMMAINRYRLKHLVTRGHRSAVRVAELLKRTDRLLGGILIGKDRKSTRLNSSHGYISYAVFCLKKKKKHDII